MNDKFTEEIDRAKSYVSKLAEEENNLPSNIDLNKIFSKTRWEYPLIVVINYS